MNERSNEFRAAIVDMDGVITRTATVHAIAWKRMFDEYLEVRGEREGERHEPFTIDRDYRRHVDGKPRYDGVRDFLGSRGIDLPDGEPDDPPSEATVCGLGNRKNQIFHELLEADGVEVWEDTVEQIRNWKRDGWKVAVFSSSRNCEAVLRAANVSDLFDAKVDGRDLERLRLAGKPAPDMLLRAAEQLGVEPSQAIVLEDAVAGVRAGKAGGFGMVVGVARDRPAGELADAGADRVVRDVRDLNTAEGCPPGENARRAVPSAISHIDRIAERLDGHRLALFLDYDGTLTPIVRRAEDAILSDEMRSLLRELAGCCTVAIISGRDRTDAEQMVRVEGLVYAGSHGFDIQGPDIRMRHEQARQALPALDQAEKQLREQVDTVSGARVERKRFAIAVHYREVAGDADLQRIEQIVDEVCKGHPHLRKKGGKKIFELQPDVEWDKGRAVSWLTDTLGMNHPGVIVIYIGDDVTDEDAFRAIRDHGIGIQVAATSSETPMTSETQATYFLRDCDEVRQFLHRLWEMVR